MSQRDQTAVFGCGPLAISVTAAPCVLEQADVYFPRMAGDADASVAAVTARVAPAELALRMARLSGPPQGAARGHPHLAYWVRTDGTGKTILMPQTGPPHLITVAAGRRSLEVVAGQYGLLTQTVIRVIRQLAIRHAERAGGLLGHAAAVAATGLVVLLAGRPGAGKTTVALLLARAGASLCAGDRTLLFPRLGGWDAAELPLAWRVAPGTLRALDLADPAASLPVRARGRDLIDGKQEFTAGELCGLLGASRVSGGPVATIVVLNRAPSQPTGTRPSPIPAKALASTLFSPQDALFTTDWLGLGALDRREAAARCEMLAAQVPVIEATWPDHAALPFLADLLAAQVGLPRAQGGAR